MCKSMEETEIIQMRGQCRWSREQHPLTVARRHVREAARVFPMDATHGLVDLRLRDRGPECFLVCGIQERGE